MPASPTPTARLPGTRAPKLRSSCDSCGAAKVKCDHGQPQCGRCVELGLICVYGLSRKFGKPPRKRPGADLDAASRKNRTVWSAESRINHTSVGLGYSEGSNDSEHLQSPNLANDMLQWPCGINTTLSVDEQNQLGSACFTPLFDDWPQLNSLGSGLVFPSVQASENRLLASTSDPISVMSTRSNQNDSHSCARESYEILRDLICPAPDLHAPESNSDTVSASLDQVLHCNRYAIDRLSRLLKCPCSKSGHRVMVHASIVSRILIWYQQAAGWTGSSSSGHWLSELAESSTSRRVSSSSPPPPASGTAAGTAPTGSPTGSPTLAQFTGFIVAHVPVSMGTFGIEDQNVQTALRNQLLLSELKQTAKLIELFTSQDFSESSAIGLADLYSHLGAWLRSEYSRTVKILKARLSALDENLHC